MIALLQRVSRASVDVQGRRIAEIGVGLMVLVAVQRGDDDGKVEPLVKRLLGYRVFPDEQGRMNLDLVDTGGELLLVPQFTLAADTARGRRPGFSTAASPEEGERLFNLFVETARQQYSEISTGRFGADMQVALVNDGPVTFWLEV